MGRDPKALASGRYLQEGHRTAFTPVGAIVIIVLAWEVAGRILGWSAETLPTPSRIVLEGVRESAKLVPHGLITAAEILGAFLLAVAGAAAVAAIGALLPGFQQALRPIIRVLQRAPLLAVMPLAFIWMGFSARSIILLACLISFPALVMDLLEGLRAPSDNILEFARLASAGRWRTLIKIQLPASLPRGIAALRTAIPMVVGAVLVGEFLVGDKGLGYLMVAAISKLETTLVFAALALVMILALLLQGVVALLEFSFLRRR